MAYAGQIGDTDQELDERAADSYITGGSEEDQNEQATADPAGQPRPRLGNQELIRVHHSRGVDLALLVDAGDEQAAADYELVRGIMICFGDASAAIAQAWQRGLYEVVAEVDTDDLETAWERTNHIDEDWTSNAGVAPKVKRARSSMMGDVFYLLPGRRPGSKEPPEAEGDPASGDERRGEYFYVGSLGFKPITL